MSQKSEPDVSSEWPETAIGDNPPFADKLIPVVERLLFAVPGIASGDFENGRHPPAPDYSKAEAWASIPQRFGKKNTINPAELVPPSVQGNAIPVCKNIATNEKSHMHAK